MIPFSLKLSNFTSYGTTTPTLDFSKFHMAAISGQNGAGKSSLLDSLTWCLWGTSRLGDSSDQLIRLGQTEMMVEFIFELDGHHFTVKRRRAAKGGGSTALEFFSGLASSPQVHNLTEGTIKATQQKIIDTLHLSYETFTNSAFLRQGHADEFTTRGPTDRKRILADILGLAHYDLLEEKAKEKAKDLQGKLQLLEYQLLEIEAELSQKEEREKALNQAEQEAEEAEKQLKEVDLIIKKIEAEKEAASTKLQALKEAQVRIRTTQTELEELKAQIFLKEKSQEEYQTILGQNTEIEENYQKLQLFQEKRRILEDRRGELIKIKDELVQVQKIIVERNNKRNNNIASLQVEKQKLQTENTQLEEQNNHLKTHQDSCPTCHQTIGQEKNKEIITKNQSFLNINNQKLKELQEKLTTYQTYILPEVKQAEEKEQQVKQLEEATSDWATILETVRTLEKYASLYTKLQQAEASVKAHQEALGDLKKIYQDKEIQIQKEQVALEGVIVYQKQLEETSRELLVKESVKQELSQKSLSLREKAGEAKQLVSRAEQLEKLAEQKKNDKSNLQKEKANFEELAQAFGKKGIQTMIIETAIPELEDEANKLLDKLTEGRMKVRFETQRETKGKINGEKGIVETLDIIISDEMGERVYEAYSGGEQFRVNFAVRLALSKLLTHRAGAKLQFLVIDEGFGTQDAQGRSRIVEAINAIKNDFEKIIIITHLDELKEEFPVRIEVQKSPAGSTFEAVGV